MGCRERHVDIARFLDRLAGVHRFEDREFARPLLEDASDPEQVFRPLLPRQRAPRATERAPRGTDGRVHVGSGCPGDVGELLLGRRVHGREGLAVRRRHVLAPDEQAVAVLDRDDVARFGRRRVLPRDRLAVAKAPARGRRLLDSGDRTGAVRRRGINRRVGRCSSRHRDHYGIRAPSVRLRGRPRRSVRRSADAGQCPRKS